MVGFVMATHGGISAVFVFIFSRLARVTGRFALFSLAAVISLVLLVVLLDWTPTSDQQTLIFIFPVLWGIGEGIWQTQTNCELLPCSLRTWPCCLWFLLPRRRGLRQEIR